MTNVTNIPSTRKKPSKTRPTCSKKPRSGWCTGASNQSTGTTGGPLHTALIFKARGLGRRLVLAPIARAHKDKRQRPGARYVCVVFGLSINNTRLTFKLSRFESYSRRFPLTQFRTWWPGQLTGFKTRSGPSFLVTVPFVRDIP